MKKIVWFAMAVVVMATLGCSRQSPVDKEREKIIELRKELYDKNSTLSSHKVAGDAIEAFRAFGNKYPEDSLAVPYHIEAAEIAWTLGKYPLSVEIFQEIAALHPTTDMMPYLYLRIGAITNDAMKDTATAKKYYTMVLEQFPESDFVEGARFGLETLGMNEEEQFLYMMRKSGQSPDETVIAEEITDSIPAHRKPSPNQPHPKSRTGNILQ